MSISQILEYFFEEGMPSKDVLKAAACCAIKTTEDYNDVITYVFKDGSLMIDDGVKLTFKEGL